LTSLVPLGESDILLQEEHDHITLEEVLALKRSCDIVYERSSKTENYHWIRDRDKLLFSLLWATGARVTDALNMKTTEISFTNNTIRFLVMKRKVHSKDKKKRKVEPPREFWHTITLDNRTLHEIADYSNTWGVKGLLFPSNRHSAKPMTRQAVNLRLNEYCSVVGLRHIIPHLFRHGLAMRMQAANVPIEAISFRLAHSSTRVTLENYARLSASQEKALLDNIGFSFW
jgi:integrase/recombinase XerD